MKKQLTISGATAIVAATICVATVLPSFAAVNNLESYHFRHDFSTGARVFMGSTHCPADFIGTATKDVAVPGPNGASNARHLAGSCGPMKFDGVEVNEADSSTTKTTDLFLNTNDWTLAMSFHPGDVEKQMLFAIGRLNGGTSSGRIAIVISSSSNPNKLYLNEFYRGSDSTPVLGNSVELTGLGNMTNGFHTLVLVYSATDKTVTPYVDGTLKTVLTLSSKKTTSRAVGNYFQYGSHPSITGIPEGFSRSYDNTDVSFYDLRFYLGQFAAADAAAYAALYPCTYPFRPNAYVEAGATNTSANATTGNYIDTGYLAKGEATRFAVDYQFLDNRAQQRIFGARGDFVQGLYVNSSGNLAWNFMGTAKWVSMAVASSRLRQTAAFDRVGKTIAVTNYGGRAQFYYNADHSDFLKTTSDATRSTYLFAEQNSGAKNFGKARIYSFEADESGAPVLFLAPDTENGEAGFRNIIDGTFHGDGNKNNNPERTLRFYNGVGCASDYKYEDSTLYAKLYATSDGKGTVSVAGGAASASAEEWIPHGGTLALSASPAANMEFAAWTGDTWAIADGHSATDASIELSTPYAVQLRATFKPVANALLTVAADGADAVAWSAADWRDIENAETAISAPVDKEVTIVAHKSFTLTVDETVALSKLTVTGDVDCVVTLAAGSGSFVATEVVVSGGVLQQGTASVLGTTPLVTVKDGGTFDINGLAPYRWTTFSLAGDGAGSFPWALTSSAAGGSTETVDVINLADDAAIGGDYNFYIGVREGATFSPTTETKPLTLNGHTLTKTGTGTLCLRRPYSTNEGTIDVQAGTLKITDWSNADVAYGESSVSNIALVVREGTTVVNGMQYGKSFYTLFFKSLDVRGGTMTSSYGAFGVWEALSGHGSIQKLAIADGAPAVLDGDLTVSGELIAAGALSLARAVGVEAEVTVTVSGTLTASGAITVGAGVVFDIGGNRPAGTLTVDDDATLVVRQADAAEETVVLNVTARPQNIVVYKANGAQVSSPDIAYDSNAGTLTISLPVPHWTNADGTGSLDSAANWNVQPESGDGVVIDLSADTVITTANDYTFGAMQFNGAYSASFSGIGEITLSSIDLNNLTNLVTGGKLRFTSLAVPETCPVTITGAEGLSDKKLTGAGTLVIDPGAGNTYTMSKNNTGFTGEAVIASGTVLFGDSKSFGAIGRSSSIRIKGGATLDEGTVQDQTYGNGEKNKVILEEGATFIHSGSNTDEKCFPVTRLTLEGDATVDTTSGNVAIGLHYNDWYSHIDLGTNTLAVTGENIFYISVCQISGAGTLDIQSGAKVYSTHEYDDKATVTTCNDGTIRIREGATWHLFQYVEKDGNLSVKNLVLDGEVTREASGSTLTVTGAITGNGTTPMLAMGSGAVFKPTGTGYLNVTESLSGTVKVDIGDPALAGQVKIPLLKVPTSLKDTADAALDLSALSHGWKLESQERDGSVEYWIKNSGFLIFMR